MTIYIFREVWCRNQGQLKRVKSGPFQGIRAQGVEGIFSLIKPHSFICYLKQFNTYSFNEKLKLKKKKLGKETKSSN